MLCIRFVSSLLLFLGLFVLMMRCLGLLRFSLDELGFCRIVTCIVCPVGCAVFEGLVMRVWSMRRVMALHDPVEVRRSGLRL